MSYFRLIIIAMLFVGIFNGCESNSQKAEVVEKKQSTKSIDTKYKLIDTNGEEITLDYSNKILFSKKYEGKMILINFWATWCPPCKKEMPALASLQEKYEDDFIIIGVLMEEEKDKGELEEFLKEYGVNFPITVNKENFRFAKDLDNVQKFPESFLFSKEGFLLQKFIGEIDQNSLESIIKNNL